MWTLRLHSTWKLTSRSSQAIASFASCSPDAKARFLAYQILSQHLMSMTSDLRAIILTELLSSCPFETMKSAAINLLKESVERDFSSGKTHLFNSPVLFQQFLPRILSHEHLGTFEESLNHLVYGVNFYLYLLIRDKENQVSRSLLRGLHFVCAKYLSPRPVCGAKPISKPSTVSILRPTPARSVD
ncbi:hypothetical protein K493DRAFT_315446 [Basidiobolus meristosporus CBS 931.73]|uniref:Uncharacterized protein n=1 Tax=Basidiobolus meristosporus CBS 931.73 TaxID=1314790 RepID=A0A1Y1Y937_9FUNG|nr:hypothetical protein K493DRAFT_315446 [Basidiobolus meristosporus CBS 931.73]|eukprot:ORX94529.1 hypothetical protein K493DRAFT_315446 [Basidiobolus meristosporus CBS 931.73]